MAHASMHGIQFESPFKCSNLCLKFWCQSHFLDEVGFHVYLMDDLSQDETDLKRKLVAFKESLGFFESVVFQCPWWLKLLLKRRDMSYFNNFLVIVSFNHLISCLQIR